MRSPEDLVQEIDTHFSLAPSYSSEQWFLRWLREVQTEARGAALESVAAICRERIEAWSVYESPYQIYYGHMKEGAESILESIEDLALQDPPQPTAGEETDRQPEVAAPGHEYQAMWIRAMERQADLCTQLLNRMADGAWDDAVEYLGDWMNGCDMADEDSVASWKLAKGAARKAAALIADQARAADRQPEAQGGMEGGRDD